MPKTPGVYWIYQASQDRAVYVGSSADVDRRMKTHVWYLARGNHPNRRLQDTWNTYGQGDFKFSVLETVDVGRLIEREQFWIDAQPELPICNTNVAAPGAMRGRHHTEETRRRIGDSSRGRTVGAEGRARMSAAHLGVKRHPHSASTRAKMSVALMGNTNTLGRKLSDESRQKIGNAQRGKKRGPMSDAHKQKIAAGNRGKTLSEETKQKISAAHRARQQKD